MAEERSPGGMRKASDVLPGIQLRSSGEGLEDEPEGDRCPICSGSGFVHPLKESGRPDYSRVVSCTCVREHFKQQKRRHMLLNCELPEASRHMTFKNFHMHPGMEEAYEAALALAEETVDFNWLTLNSDSDRGKTHLLVAICHHRLKQEKPARYAYIPLLLDELRHGFREGGDLSYEARFDFFLNVPLLALDDLGTEHRTPWVQERLDTILDYRLMHGLGLVVTTNLPMDELPFRIANRLQRKGRVVVIDAPAYSEIKESLKSKHE